jgi:hypothetical protein
MGTGGYGYRGFAQYIARPKSTAFGLSKQIPAS